MSRRVSYRAAAWLATVWLAALVTAAAPSDARATTAPAASAGAHEAASGTVSPQAATTPRYGVDYSKTAIDWPTFFRELKATGRTFIGRYLPVTGATWRAVTKTELTAAAAAGIDCLFWFENSNDAYRAMEGYAAGVADAREALAALTSLGVPTTTPVYYTVDWPPWDGSKIGEYFRGVASVVPVSQIGAYGTYETVDWLYKHKLATYFCQTTAWMNDHGWHPKAQMRQDTSQASIGGVGVDTLTVTTSRFGQYRMSGSYTPLPASDWKPCLRYEQSDSRLLYSGTWLTASSQTGLYSGDSYTCTTAADGSVTIAFLGRALNWIATTSPGSGSATVSVDGRAATSVSLRSPTRRYKQVVWSTGLLTTGVHKVRIKHSTGTVNIDAFDVIGRVLLPYAKLQESSSAFVYDGSWTSFFDTAASESYYQVSSDAGASVSIPFRGRRLDLYCTMGPAMGMVDISVDGGPARTVDLRAASLRFKQRVWTSGDLFPRMHVVKISRSPLSAPGTSIDLDAVEMIGTLSYAVIRYEQGEPRITFSAAPASWSKWSDPAASAGSYLYSDLPGATATFGFWGCRIALISRTHPNAGKVRIILDKGTRAQTNAVVDLYSPVSLYKQKVWSSGILGLGRHMVTIQRMDSKNPASGGTSVNVDAVDLTGFLR